MENDDPWFPIEYYNRRVRADQASYEGEVLCPELPGYHEESEETWRQTIRAVSGRVTIDLGCGTGRWSERLLPHCPSVIGVDASPTRLEVCRERHLVVGDGLSFVDADIRALTPAHFSGLPSPEALFARYILSHWPKEEIGAWIEMLQRLVPSGSPLVLMDNRIEEFNRGLGEIPESPDAYCERVLDDGSAWKIRKNYFEVEEVVEFLNPYCSGIEAWQGKWLWSVVASL